MAFVRPDGPSGIVGERAELARKTWDALRLASFLLYQKVKDEELDCL